MAFSQSVEKFIARIFFQRAYAARLAIIFRFRSEGLPPAPYHPWRPRALTTPRQPDSGCLAVRPASLKGVPSTFSPNRVFRDGAFELNL
ncbi:MAG: hypothetical protein DMG57_21370 [Acidobacteria bacterium]|nr:MAG: hypothetical protein DMG57_21370 [Acidobacteriota bacterium]